MISLLRKLKWNNGYLHCSVYLVGVIVSLGLFIYDFVTLLGADDGDIYSKGYMELILSMILFISFSLLLLVKIQDIRTQFKRVSTQNMDQYSINAENALVNIDGYSPTLSPAYSVETLNYDAYINPPKYHEAITFPPQYFVR